MEEIIEKENIENMIYEIRGVQVMLDSDIAKLYQVEPKRVNEAVKRNIEKFPERFSWQLSMEECDSLRSQIATLENRGKGQYSKYLPRVFTEQGLYMLATILKSTVATNVTIAIIDAFVKMRRYFVINKDNNEILINHENRLLLIENTLDKYKEKELNKIFFEGQMYDAYSLLIDLFNKSKEEIIIIDNYAGKDLLDTIKKINKKIIIVSKNIDETLINKYKSQYENVIFKYNDSFHDRFIILDKNKLYTCGASLKDLGKKCFAINEIINKEYLKDILKIINE